MTKAKKILLIVLAVPVGLFLVGAITICILIAVKDEDEKFITASFVDPEQIEAISKFRSCAGHNSGRILDADEPVSSLKHYVNPKPEYTSPDNRFQIYAPFDGRIIGGSTAITNRGKHVFLSPSYSAWAMGFDHIDPLPKVKFGYTFKAGELLGYASFNEEHPESSGIDVELAFLPQLDYGVASVFSHMTDDVLEEFAEYSVAPENMVISREEREANPCECHVREDTECAFDRSVEDLRDMVKLITD